MTSPLPDSYRSLRCALRTRLDLIADTAWRDRDPEGHLNALRVAGAEINARAAALDPSPPAELAHYLEGQSLSKALEWLDNAARQGGQMSGGPIGCGR